MAIAIAGSLVWAHHMFSAGMSDVAVFVFSLLTYIVAIPSAVKVFNWIATLYKGSIVMTPPLFLALCFIYLFTTGGLMGLVLGSAATDLHVHDTHFVVSHFHFVMFGGGGFAFFAGVHHWFPKMFGKMYDFRKAYRATVLLTIGFMLHYVPMAIAGLKGMPRRYYTYPEQFHLLNLVAGLGGVLMIAAIFHMVFNLVQALRKGAIAEANPWGGKTLEWQIASPPPTDNFLTPVVFPTSVPVINKGSITPGGTR
jgi:cytochrome c oxidase subunit 1